MDSGLKGETDKMCPRVEEANVQDCFRMHSDGAIFIFLLILLKHFCFETSKKRGSVCAGVREAVIWEKLKLLWNSQRCDLRVFKTLLFLQKTELPLYTRTALMQPECILVTSVQCHHRL